MVTKEDRVMALLREGNPATALDEDAWPDLNAAAYLATLESRSSGVTDRERYSFRRGMLIGGVAVGIAAVIVGVALWSQQGEGSPVAGQQEPPAPATTSADIITSSAAPEPFSPFLLDLRTGAQTPLADIFADAALVASPDGTRLLTNRCCAYDDAMTIANVDGSEERRLDPLGKHNYYGGNWSPDGTRIVYQAKDGATGQVGNLFVEDVVSGEQTQVTNFEPMTAYWWWLAPSFSADGRQVYFTQPRDRETSVTEFDVWSVPVTGGEPTLVEENASQWVSLPYEEPSGAFIVPTFNSPDGPSIGLLTSEGRRTLVEVVEGLISEPSASPDGSRIVYEVSNPFEDNRFYVVDVSTGVSSLVFEAGSATWLDNDTLAVGP
jgi:Tol biopolymer transport system component